jgi:acetyl-CoA C-acetyltransferase
MADIVIAGIGQIPVGEYWQETLHSLATRAIRTACRDAGGMKPQAMYIGNLLSSNLSHQANLGALLAQHSGLSGIESYTIEAAEASAAGAFHLAYLAISSGYIDSALVVGVEKVTDAVGSKVESAITEITDYDYEGISGITPAGLAAILMRRYLQETHAPRQALAGFAVTARENAVHNPMAFFQKKITLEDYEKSELVCDPLNQLDIAPVADGAAALLLARDDLVPKDFPHALVKVTASKSSIDALSLHDRSNPLVFTAAQQSVQDACSQAGIVPGDVDFFELTDSSTIYTILSLEAAGFAKQGEGWKQAEKPKIPISTLGGWKGRGNPLGAGGAYQLAEAALQLRGEAGKAQLKTFRRGMVQTLGGAAATAITHILERFI